MMLRQLIKKLDLYSISYKIPIHYICVMKIYSSTFGIVNFYKSIDILENFVLVGTLIAS